MIKKLVMGTVAVGICCTLGGCVRPYNTPDFTEISPSQTAFMIPLIGDGKTQAKIQSEDMLKQNMVSAKRVQIPKSWVKTGRMWWNGKYMPSSRVIVVERKPVTREWTESKGDGTSAKNEGIIAETRESIGFLARMNCTAQIDENQASKFLYHYNVKTLEEIVDSQIRARVESKFNEQVAKLSLSEVLVDKEKIMNTVREDVIPYFSERGINITTLGLKGEITYLDGTIQSTINDKFKAQKNVETQKLENDRLLEKANAEAEAIKKQASTIKDSIELRKIEVEKIKAEAEVKKAEAMKEWKNMQVVGGNQLMQIEGKK